MIPPHLPAPLCNIKNHERWINIKIVIAASVVGLIAGITGASIALGWIWPNYSEGDTWIVSRSQSNSNGLALEEIVRKESSERIFSVYRSASKLASLDYLAQSEKIGEAVAISSDGWLALYIREGMSQVTLDKIRIVSSDGAIFGAQKYLYDSQTRIAYIKVYRPQNKEPEGSAVTQFKVASFEDDILTAEDIYVYQDGDWQFSRTGYKKFISPSATRLDSAPSYVYSLNADFSAGSVAITGRGRVAGFVIDENRLLPINAVTRIMPSVLSRGKIEYPSFGTSGWFSGAQPAVSGANQLSGYVVANVWLKSSKLRRGDVIMEINGQIVRDESLWYNIGGKEATLTISRAGKVFDLPAEIYQASPDLK